MNKRLPLLPLALVLAGCASGAATATPSAQPVGSAGQRAATPSVERPTSPSAPASGSASAPAPALTRAPDAWQLLDAGADRVPGVSAERAYVELLAGRSPARTVVVAVIDGGVDTAHVDLRDNLWRNSGETAGNGLDDDGNGYVDDLYGWNFIGGPDGRSVHHETLEVTRLHARCLEGETSPAGLECTGIAQGYETEKTEAEETLAQIEQLETAMGVVIPMLQRAAGTEELTADNVRAIQGGGLQVQQAKNFYLQLDAAGISAEDLTEAKEAYQDLLEYGLDLEFETRSLVGDDPEDGSERVYGNRDVMGPDAGHGTHVSGIIGALRDNDIGMNGIAPDVRLMTIRAVPDGDERDKDVANAIRYAVDNGAHVINMSFGKGYSPQKALVDDAVRYADERGVLMIHAAGNDGVSIETEPNFPTPFYADGGRAQNWIEVGAANWSVESLAAPFSNYGRSRVDVFAPGVDILSTVPGGDFDREDGTSMAAPVVTGVAALLLAYFPELTAADVRRILLESSTRYRDATVPAPGSGEPVPFGSLSVTGGVVNAFEAVRMALGLM